MSSNIINFARTNHWITIIIGYLEKTLLFPEHDSRINSNLSFIGDFFFHYTTILQAFEYEEMQHGIMEEQRRHIELA